MRAVSFGARFSISLSSVVRMTASVYLAEIYCTLVSISTEAKRNRTFAPCGRTNSRQSAVSLLQFSYDLVFSTMRDEESCDFNESTRVKLSRANILMPLLRLMQNRATNLFKWATPKESHISRTPPVAGTRRGMAPESLCAPSA